MFTGLIEIMGRVSGVRPGPAGARVTVDARAWSHRAAPGDSIAVNGCCLTVANDAASCDLEFDVVPETLALTTIGRLAAGSNVNLEHAATAATLLGGHIVQGHIDGVAVVDRVVTDGERRVRLRPPAPLMEYIIPKGSIAVDGVSLTVAAVDPSQGWFEVALIPTTLAKTTLGELRAGAECNIETDAMARTVVHWIRHFGTGSR